MKKEGKSRIIAVIIFHVLCIIALFFCSTKKLIEEVHAEEKKKELSAYTDNGNGRIVSGENNKPTNETKPSSIPSGENKANSSPVTKTPEPTKTPAPTATPTLSPTPTPTSTPTPMPTPVVDKEYYDTRAVDVYEKMHNGYYDRFSTKVYSFSFRRNGNHEQPGSYMIEYPELKGTYFHVKSDVTDEDKVVYLTFDCGFASNRTNSLLDTLKAHNAKATFFVTSNYIKGTPKNVLRMIEEGHDVANHTVSHIGLTGKDLDTVFHEVVDCEKDYYELTGKPISPYFRLPEGKYNEQVLQILVDLGYTTYFWSVANGDYITDPKQPGYVTPEIALNDIKTNHHNGALILLHNNSQSNVDALDSILTFLESEGYRFGLLNEFLE